MNVNYVFIKCFLGEITVAETDDGVCAILFDKNIKSLEAMFSKAELKEASIKNSKWAREFLDFIESPENKLNISLHLEGTEFQKQVWKALLKIPVGKTASYKDIAIKIRRPLAVRAVANACGANKIPVIIPCHRVISSNGDIGGYSGGLDIKKKLLQHEGIKF